MIEPRIVERFFVSRAATSRLRAHFHGRTTHAARAYVPITVVGTVPVLSVPYLPSSLYSSGQPRRSHLHAVLSRVARFMAAAMAAGMATVLAFVVVPQEILQ